MNDCIEFDGAIGKHGYGNIRIGQRYMRAHRLAWEREFGPISDGVLVLHKCDNRKCINTNHLFLGSQKDNVVDAMNKGRRPIALHGTRSMYVHHKCRCHECKKSNSEYARNNR